MIFGMSLALGLALALMPQPASPPLPRASIELERAVTVTAADYLAHLYAEIGSARLEELLLDRVFEREVASLPRDAIASDVAAVLADPDAHATARIAAEIRQAGITRGEWDRHQRDLGLRPDEVRWRVRTGALREARITALVQSRRQAGPAELRRVFEQNYGVDGLRVVVRHVFQSFGAEREKLRASGTAIEEAELEERVQTRVAGLAALHRAGTPFHLLIARGSEDRKGRVLALDPSTADQAGVIEGYNFQHYGVEFATAVRAMQVGEVAGPVRTSHGYHLIQLVSAERTEFAAVEPRVRELLRVEAPSLAERRTLLESLRAQYGIDAALRR